MPVGGKLVLKGGLQVTSTGVGKATKKKKRKPVQEVDAADDDAPKSEAGDKKTSGAPITKPAKAYEEEFSLEMEKARQGKAKATPWGSGYKAAPEILHGYTKKVSGKTAEERLDLRSAIKSDKFCK